MRNITVSVDDDTYRRSRIRAAEMETSVSAGAWLSPTSRSGTGPRERRARSGGRDESGTPSTASGGGDRRLRRARRGVANGRQSVPGRAVRPRPRWGRSSRGGPEAPGQPGARRLWQSTRETAKEHALCSGAVIRCGCETVTMKNITVSVDDDIYRRSRIRAAELETSVSALVRGFLERLVQRGAQATGADAPRAETEGERRRRLLDEVFEDICATRGGFRAADNVGREVLHDRDAIR